MGSGVPGIDFSLDPQNVLNKETDSATGWSYHGARWMASSFAMWLSPDPPVKAPDGKFMGAPWGLNPYQYVEQNPGLYRDPDGRFKLPIHKSVTDDAMALAHQVANWEVNQSHDHQDSLIPGQLMAPWHFDNSQFLAGIANVDLELSRYRASKMTVLDTRGASEGNAALGRALHGIQDFYAHSTFIDLFAAFDTNAISAPTFEEVFDTQNSGYKANSGFRSFIKGHAIRSGAFSLVDIGTYGQGLAGDHGHGVVAKDAPSRDPVQNRLHILARGAATRASAAAITSGRAFQGRENAKFGEAVK